MSNPRVIRCPPAQRADALRRLQAAHDSKQQESLAQAVSGLDRANEAAWAGLLIAASPDDGAIWVQPAAGNAAVVWPPCFGNRSTGSLFQAAAAFVDQRGIALAQMLVAEIDGFSPAELAEWGFPRLAELRYLFAQLPGLPEARDSPAGLQFHPHAGDESDRLAAAIERTYIGSLDCPALDGARSMREVLEGYRAQGRHMPEHWYFVEHRGRDVGVLLLADHPPSGNWELVYMGLVPEARGRGWGERLVRFALQAMTAGGAQRLVLAVDAANGPALATYRTLHFNEWDRRTVFARLGAGAIS